MTTVEAIKFTGLGVVAGVIASMAVKIFEKIANKIHEFSKIVFGRFTPPEGAIAFGLGFVASVILLRSCG